MKFHRDLLIRSKIEPEYIFFRDFFGSVFLRSMGAVSQNWLIPQKFHKNKVVEFQKVNNVPLVCGLEGPGRLQSGREHFTWFGL